MSTPLIQSVGIIDCRDMVSLGDQGLVVSVTASGTTGFYGPISAKVAALVEEYLGPAVVGTPVSDHAALQRRVRRSAGAQVGRAMSWAVGAIDCAVWDLHGRIEHVPVARLLAPWSARIDVPAYASWLRLDVTDPTNADAVRQIAQENWLFTKWSLRRGRDSARTGEGGRLAAAVHRVSTLVGAPAAFDGLGTWDPDVAADFAEAVDHGCLVWLEDPLPTDALDIYARMGTHLSLTIGERLQVDGDPSALLDQVVLAALALDVVGCGGITRAVEVVSVASAAAVPVYPHGRSLLPALHLAAAFPDAVPGIEYQIQWEPRRQRLFTDPVQVSSGRVPIPGTFGLGVTPWRRECRSTKTT